MINGELKEAMPPKEGLSHIMFDFHANAGRGVNLFIICHLSFVIYFLFFTKIFLTRTFYGLYWCGYLTELCVRKTFFMFDGSRFVRVPPLGTFELNQKVFRLRFQISRKTWWTKLVS